MQHASKIAESRAQGRQESHIFQGVPFQGNRIVKEMLFVVNPGDPVAQQHHPVCFLRIRPSRYNPGFPSQDFVILWQGALQRHHFPPPVHHPLILRKEPVPADIHPFSPILHRPGDTADFTALLQYNHFILFSAAQQFQRSSQAGWAGPYNYCSIHLSFSSSPVSSSVRPCIYSSIASATILE